MSQPSQADILAALASASSSTRPKRQTIPYSTDALDELITPPFSASPVASADASAPAPSASRNARRVYCPREGCASLILLEKAGTVVQTEGGVLPSDPNSPFPPSQSPHLYLHLPDPFAFENIGYSRPDASLTLPAYAPGGAVSSAEGPDALTTPTSTQQRGQVKWLICADCDLGPLGWGWEGGKGAWVDMARVRYGEGAVAKGASA